MPPAPEFGARDSSVLEDAETFCLVPLTDAGFRSLHSFQVTRAPPVTNPPIRGVTDKNGCARPLHNGTIFVPSMPLPRSKFDDGQGNRDGQQLAAGPCFQLALGLLDILMSRGRRDAELFGDPAIGQPLGD